MNKSTKLIQEMDDEELKILLLAFSKPKVLQAIKCYHTIPNFLKHAFIEPGKKEMLKRGIVVPLLKGNPQKLELPSDVEKSECVICRKSGCRNEECIKDKGVDV